MKIWILGAGGQVGTALIDYCAALNISFVASKHREVDITNLDQLKLKAETIQCTHLINASAYTDVDKAEKNEKEAMNVNATGPENLGILANHFPMQIVHISTDYVFDGEKGAPYLETDKPNPLGVYGKSKYEGEQNLLDHFPTACIVRTSWVFGLRGKNFISNIASMLQTKSQIQAVDDQMNRATYNRDLARALVDLCCHSGIYHYANTDPMSRFQIVQDFLAEAKKRNLPTVCEKVMPISHTAFPALAPRPKCSVLDTKKVENLLGRKSRKWKEILEEVFSHA